jgi:hypothetical protein
MIPALIGVVIGLLGLIAGRVLWGRHHHPRSHILGGKA